MRKDKRRENIHLNDEKAKENLDTPIYPDGSRHNRRNSNLLGDPNSQGNAGKRARGKLPLGSFEEAAPRINDDRGRGNYSRRGERDGDASSDIQDPPGILDWIIDAELGLFSPLLKNIGKALVDAIPLPLDFTDAIKLDAQLKKLVPGYPLRSPASKAAGSTPAEEWTNRVNESIAQELAVVGILAATVAATVLDYGGECLDEIWKVPTIAAMVDRITDLRSSEYEIGQKPLIRRYWLKQYKPFVPPIQDLRLMAVREAFPVAPGEPQYAEMEKWALEQGMDPYWTDRYLAMGFERMKVDDAMRYFLWYHDLPAEYEEWLRIADIHPDDRPKVREVSYTPPGMRELGYGFDMGVYFRPDIVSALRRIGRSPTDAEKCADAMIAYRTFAETEAVRREWLHLVSMGRKTMTEFRAKLVELKTNPLAIELWLERAELETERRLKPEMDVEGRIITSSEALWALEHDLRDVAWTRACLKALDWEDDRIDLAIERIYTRLEEAKKPPPPVEYRKLTLSQIRDLYRFRYVSMGELPGAFIGVGYSPEDADRLARILIDVEAESARAEYDAEKRKLRDNAMADLVKGYITEDILRADLAEVGYPPEAIEYYVADAKADRERAHKTKLLDIYDDAYQKDLKTYEDLEADAAAIIVDADALDLFLAEAYIRKYKKPKVTGVA